MTLNSQKGWFSLLCPNGGGVLLCLGVNFSIISGSKAHSNTENVSKQLPVEMKFSFITSFEAKGALE